MKIKLTRATYTHTGELGEAGQIIDIDEKNARFLIAIGKAVKFEEPVIATPEEPRPAEEYASPKRRGRKAAEEEEAKEDEL